MQRRRSSRSRALIARSNTDSPRGAAAPLDASAHSVAFSSVCTHLRECTSTRGVCVRARAPVRLSKKVYCKKKGSQRKRKGAPVREEERGRIKSVRGRLLQPRALFGLDAPLSLPPFSPVASCSSFAHFSVLQLAIVARASRRVDRSLDESRIN